MKRLLKYILAAVLLTAASASCRKDYEETFFLAVDYASIDFPFTDGHSYVQIHSTGDWTVSFAEGEVSWCHLDKTSGSGRGAVRVDVDANMSGAARTATLLVRREDVCKEIKINQKTVN